VSTKYRTLFESMDEGYCVVEMIFDADNRPADFVLETEPGLRGNRGGLRDAQGKQMREMAPDHDAHWFRTPRRVAVTGGHHPLRQRATRLASRSV
jgi:hypothetical protein